MDEENVLDENLVEETNNVDNVENVVDNNEIVVEDTAESEAVQEEAPAQMYSQQDVDNILDARTKSLNRRHKKEMQKELKEYKKMQSILEQGLGVTGSDNIINQLTEFYTGQGIEIKQDDEDNSLNDEDQKILAEADLKKIKSYGDGEIIETAKELADKKSRTVREEALLQGLMHEISLKRATEDLKSINADKSIYESEEFKTFASKFNPNESITEIYNLYKKQLPQKKQPETAGSMKSVQVDNAVKDFYTSEEAKKFTNEDYDRNPALWEAVQRSMYSGKW